MTSSESSLRPGAYRFTVSEPYAGLRLDQFLAEVGTVFSRTLIKRLIDVGGVHLDGRRMRRCSQLVSAGSSIEVFVEQNPAESLVLDKERILYRDQYILVLDKPAGMATQPTPARYKGTVYAELEKLLHSSNKQHRPSIGMVQRLDKNTSGVMVFSIHTRAHKKMTEAFRGRNLDKLYWALVDGIPPEPEGVFRSALARRHSTNLMVSVERGGKSAETKYRVLRSTEKVSLVEVELVTGRSHQIRAHFSEAGLPLLGDLAYGGPEHWAGLKVPRQMLHSRELSFVHPVSQTKVHFSAPLPADFSALLHQVDAGLNGVDPTGMVARL